MASDFSSILMSIVMSGKMRYFLFIYIIFSFPSFQFDGLRHSVFIQNSVKRKEKKKTMIGQFTVRHCLANGIVNLHLRFLAAVLVLLCCKGYATYCGKA